MATAAGGYTSATIDVVGGEWFYVQVGQGGAATSSFGYGGEQSAVYASVSQSSVVIAGGGGGSGGHNNPTQAPTCTAPRVEATSRKPARTDIRWRIIPRASAGKIVDRRPRPARASAGDKAAAEIGKAATAALRRMHKARSDIRAPGELAWPVDQVSRRPKRAKGRSPEISPPLEGTSDAEYVSGTGVGGHLGSGGHGMVILRCSSF